MPTYTQRVTLSKEIEIHAKNAAEASAILQHIVYDAVSDSGFENDGYYSFEDEPVTCPQCKGDGTVPDGFNCEEIGNQCAKCWGEGTIPFESD